MTVARRRRRRADLLRLTVMLGALGAAAAAVHASGLRFQHTGSLPRGLYREVDGAPYRGAVGMWCAPSAAAALARSRGYIARGPCPGDAEPLGKVVLALHGDTVTLREDGIAVNGRPVPHSRPLTRDTRGRPLAPAPFGTYVLGVDEVWLWSPYSSASFDSRYFGPVATRALVSLVRPVWTTRDMRAVTTPAGSTVPALPISRRDDAAIMPPINRSTDPAVILAFRTRLGLTQRGLSRALGCGSHLLGRYEQQGAPAWVRYAMFAYAVGVHGLTHQAAATLLGLSAASGDHVIAPTPDGRPA